MFNFNGVVYAVTSSLIPPKAKEEIDNLGRRQRPLFHFSLAICDPKTGRKQISLNNLSVVEVVTPKGKIYQTIKSPMSMGRFDNCPVVSFIPGVEDDIQNIDRQYLMDRLLPVLENVAKESLSKKIRA